MRAVLTAMTQSSGKAGGRPVRGLPGPGVPLSVWPGLSAPGGVPSGLS